MSSHAQFSLRYGTWAMVLGAAQGLGESFANKLAQRGINVCLVDIQENGLLRVAAEIQDVHQVKTHTIIVDLASREAVTPLTDWLAQTKDCRLFVYSAAYGPVKMFLDNEPEELDRYVDTNARSLIQLAHAFSRRLVSDNASGGMIFISSLAGLWGTALVSPYGATKAFDWNLGEALNYELASFDIDVLAVCAGAMDTPHYLSTEPQYDTLKPSIQRSEDVAEQSLLSLGKRALLIPGIGNRFTYFLLGRVLPRAWAARLLNKTMMRMYKIKWQPEKWLKK
jgi:short-subunit dehydrogenase